MARKQQTGLAVAPGTGKKVQRVSRNSNPQQRRGLTARKAAEPQLKPAREAVHTRAEVARRENQDRLRTVLQATGVGFWLNETPLDRLHWDKRTRELFFVGPEEEPTLELFWSRLHPADREPTRLAMEQAMQDKTLYGIEHRAIHPLTGQLRWIRSAGAGVYDPRGQLVCFDGINYDITEHKAFQTELERQVTERTARLQEVVAELEHFSYSITHDMRAPLRAMRGFAEAARELCLQGQEPEQRRFLDRISAAAERLDGLITDALNYSKTVRHELPLGPVDLLPLLRGMLESYPNLQNWAAQIQIAPDLPRVLGNEAGLTQCFSNLLSNAVKFTQPGQPPQVRIWAEAVRNAECGVRSEKTAPPPPLSHSALRTPHSALVRVWIADRGVGISPRLLPRVFEMFVRGSDARAGTGIGLALVRKVVDRMGGRVGVESHEGQGSRFWIELPVAP